MPKGRKASLIIRVDKAAMAAVENREAYSQMNRTEIANYALRKLNEGLESDRRRSWSVSLVNAVARACGAKDVIVTLSSSVDDDARVTHSLGACIDGKMIHHLPVLED